MNKPSDTLIACFLVLMTAIGAYTLNTYTPYLTIVVIILISILVVKGKLHNYSIWVWCISACLVLGTTMLGHYIVGSDIHGEYYVANKGLDINYQYVNNTSALLVFVCPALKFIGISVLWQFKLLFPLLYSLVPVILYFAFKKQIGGIKAFYAVLFFMIVPVFFIEIAQIEKSMIAEIFLALMVYVIASKEIKGFKKHLSLASCAMMATLCHYTIGIFVIMFLCGYYGVPFICNLVRIKAIRLPYRNVKWALLPIIGIVATFVLWFGMIGDGFMLTYFNNVAHNSVTAAKSPFVETETIIAPMPTTTIIVPSVTPTDKPVDNPRADKVKSIGISYMDRQEPLVRTAVGMDFFDSSIQGKAFRLVQYLTQGLIVIGFMFLLWKYKQYNFTPEFVGCIATAFAIILGVIFVPQFSSLVNASRYYQACLFFLAPMLVVGVEQLCLAKK